MWLRQAYEKIRLTHPYVHGICIYVWCDCRQRVREQIEKDKRDRAAKVKSW